MNPFDTMTPEAWGELKVLKREGSLVNWGNPDNISAWLIHELDKALIYLNCKVVITSGTDGRHTTRSWHYPNPEEGRPGCAIDFIIPSLTRQQLPDVFIELLRFDFKGIGIYNSWKLSPEGKALGGFHVEWNDKPQRALWLRTIHGDFKPTLKALRESFLPAF